MTVRSEADGATLRSQTRPFHFLLREMPDEIQKEDPWVLVQPARAQAPKGAPADAQYTCPTASLKSFRDAPGACPIAALALEPMVLRMSPARADRLTRRSGSPLASSAPDRLTIRGGGRIAGRDWIGHQDGPATLKFVRPRHRACSIAVFKRGLGIRS